MVGRTTQSETGSDATTDDRPTPRAGVRPSAATRRRLLRWPLRTGVSCLAVALAYAYLLPPRFDTESLLYAWLVWLAAMVRTFGLHLGVACIVAAIAAFLLRARWTALAAIGLAAIQLLPITLDALTRGPEPPPGTTAVRFVTANLLADNGEQTAMAAALRDADADVLLLLEYTPDWHDALAGLRDAYDDWYAEPREGVMGQAIYSRLPLVGTPTIDTRFGSSRHPQLRAVVDAGGTELVVYGVHAIQPLMLRYTLRRHREAGLLIDTIASETGPTIVAGDFNWTNGSPMGAAVRALGYVDALDSGSRGLNPTWPMRGRFGSLPVAGIRIDHVYYRGGVACYRSETRQAPGSDHRMVVAELGIVPRIQ